MDYAAGKIPSLGTSAATEAAYLLQAHVAFRTVSLIEGPGKTK